MKFITTFVLGVIAGILGVILVTGFWPQPKAVQFEATYLLDVNQSDAEEFSKNISSITGRGLGYILGSSNMMLIPTSGTCYDNNTLETALRQYLDSNQFVCLPIAITQ